VLTGGLHSLTGADLALWVCNCSAPQAPEPLSPASSDCATPCINLPKQVLCVELTLSTYLTGPVRQPLCVYLPDRSSTLMPQRAASVDRMRFCRRCFGASKPAAWVLL